METEASRDFRDVKYYAKLEAVPGTLIRRTNIKRLPDGRLLFCGLHGIYNDSGDIVKQIAIIINLWNSKGQFPVEFSPLNMGASVVDETVSFIKSINDDASSVVK